MRMRRYQVEGQAMWSRRDVLRMGLGAGLALAAVPGKEAYTGAQEQPRYGGILTMWLGGDPPNLDIHQASTYQVDHAVAPCYNQLIQFDPSEPDAIIPDLAEHWEMAPDGRSYTFFLRQGVKFHDGALLTSADVKVSLDRVRDPPKGVVSPRAGAFMMVEEIETPDDFTVQIRLRRPNPSLLPNLAQGWMAIYPKHVLEKEGDMKKVVVGTGPFKLKKYTHGVSVELVKNPEYFVKGRPYMDGITLFIIPDANTGYAAFQTRRLLMMFFLDTALGHRTAQELGDKVTLQKVPGYAFRPTFNMNAQRKPWDNVRVREAASLAIDRRAAIKVIDEGDGLIGGYMPPFGPWALPQQELQKIPGYGPDIEANRARARQLLAEAGYPQGFKTTMLTRKGGYFEKLSVFLKDQLVRVGIDATLDVQETAAAYDLLDRRAFDSAPWAHAVAIDDPDAIFGEFYTCKAVRNYSGVCVPEADALFDRQSQTLDLAQRQRLVHELEQVALRGYGKIVTHWTYWFLGHWPQVKNFRQHPSLYNNQRMQDVWIAS